MSPALPVLIIFAAAGIGLLIGMKVLRRHVKPGQPRANQRQQRKLLWFLVPMFLLQMALAVQQRNWINVVLFAIVIAINIWAAYRDPRATEQLRNWVMDPTRCGRCEYDLTGNVSGVCPECGWVIPTETPLLEDIGWAAWWRGWRIGYLENWRRTAAGHAAGVVALLVLATFQFTSRVPAVAIFTLVLAALVAVNLIRVLQYGFRHRDKAATT